MNLLMASSAQTITRPRLMGLPLVSRASTRWIVRAPGRSGVLSPDEAAHALQARRAELRAAVNRRKDARFLSQGVRDEVVDEAIAVVVMSRKPIQNEEHLQGAFWTSVGYLVGERRAGRHELRVGSQHRVAFEPLEGELAGEDEPFDFVEARDRVLRALDLVSQLDPLERRVLAIMGGYGVGVKRAAKALGLPIKTVLAASRSANRKLDHVTAILAAGRMCEYRAGALHALADGTALEEEAKIAQAHMDACSACRREHVLLAREMASAQYKRAASARSATGARRLASHARLVGAAAKPRAYPYAGRWRCERRACRADARRRSGRKGRRRCGRWPGRRRWCRRQRHPFPAGHHRGHAPSRLASARAHHRPGRDKHRADGAWRAAHDSDCRRETGGEGRAEHGSAQAPDGPA